MIGLLRVLAESVLEFLSQHRIGEPCWFVAIDKGLQSSDVDDSRGVLPLLAQ